MTRNLFASLFNNIRICFALIVGVCVGVWMGWAGRIKSWFCDVLVCQSPRRGVALLIFVRVFLTFCVYLFFETDKNSK